MDSFDPMEIHVGKNRTSVCARLHNFSLGKTVLAWNVRDKEGHFRAKLAVLLSNLHFAMCIISSQSSQWRCFLWRGAKRVGGRPVFFRRDLQTATKQDFFSLCFFFNWLSTELKNDPLFVSTCDLSNSNMDFPRQNCRFIYDLVLWWLAVLKYVGNVLFNILDNVNTWSRWKRHSRGVPREKTIKTVHRCDLRLPFLCFCELA